MWANFLIGSVFEFTQSNVDFRALVHQHEIEFYGQDEYRIRPNLTLNYGVRYSLFLAPTYGNGMLSTFDPAQFNPLAAPALNPDGTFPGGADSGSYANGIIIGGKNSPMVKRSNARPMAVLALASALPGIPLAADEQAFAEATGSSSTPRR